MQICVVGTGPSALIATLKLVSSGNLVTIIESSKNLNVGTDLRKKLILKKRDHSANFFASGTPLANSESSDVMPIETRSFGGLSNIWGGVFFPPFLDYYSKKFGIRQEDFDEILDICGPSLKVKKTNAHTWNDLLKNFVSANSKFVLPINPQIAENNMGDIWSATDSWSQIQDNKIQVINGIVEKVVSSRNAIALQIRDNQEVRTISFDHVFLACGPIGNAKILAKSFKQNLKIHLSDSGVSYRLTLNRKKSVQMIKSMRPDYCGFVIQDKFPLVYFQHYKFSEELIKSLRFKWIQILARVTNKISGNRLGILMIFQNDTDSKKLEVFYKIEKNVLKSKSQIKKVDSWQVMVSLKSYFSSLKIFVSPIKFFGRVGEGAHLAGPDFSELKKQYNDDLLSQINVRVHPLGMSISDRVLAGPITYLGMVLTKKYVDKFLNGL